MSEPQLRHVCPPETAGFLVKARKFPPSRRKSFYRLNGAVFTRHQSEQHTLCREKVVVVGAVCKSHSHNGFILSLPHGDFVFYARNSFECQMWINALQEASDFRLEHYYDVRKVIGAGGFAEVRVAYDRVTRAKVAVKTIDKKGSTDAFLQREISIMRKVRHPNVVQTIDIFESVNKYHIVMEFLSGGSLFDLMSGNRRFAECEVRHLMRQILVGLSYIHSRGIVHRDLKPENILLCGDEPFCAKIADFGLSNFHEECSEVLMKTLIGTPQFVAPELVRNEAYGMEVDAAEVLAKFRSGNFMIEYAPSKWRHLSREAQSLTRMLLCTDASRRLNAVGALRHKWFSRYRCDEDNVIRGSITPTALMRFRKCVHAMRFLKRVLAKAGMVTTFKVEQLVIHRREDAIYRQSSSTSVGTADESEWDFVVQDVERMASRLDSISVSSNPRSPREDLHIASTDWRGDRANVLASLSCAPSSYTRSTSGHHISSPVSPSSIPVSTLSNAPRSTGNFPNFARAGSMNAGSVNPAGSLGAALRLDRANTAVAGGFARPLQSMVDNVYMSGADELGSPSNHKTFKSVLSEMPFTRSPTAVGELNLRSNSPISGVYQHNGNAGTNLDENFDHEITLRKRGRVREATRRLFGNLRGPKKNAGR